MVYVAVAHGGEVRKWALQWTTGGYPRTNWSCNSRARKALIILFTHFTPKNYLKKII